MAKKIYVLSLVGSNLVEVECVTKLIFSCWKDYAIRWTYTTDKNEVETLKAQLIGA